MSISELLLKCEIKQGWSKNERLYVYNGDEILRNSTRTKNVWLNNCIKKYSNLSETQIEHEIKEFLGAKKALFSDITEVQQELEDKMIKLIEEYRNATNKLPSVEMLAYFLPEPAIEIIKKHYN